jgi:hypothetical protein
MGTYQQTSECVQIYNNVLSIVHLELPSALILAGELLNLPGTQASLHSWGTLFPPLHPCHDCRLYSRLNTRLFNMMRTALIMMMLLHRCTPSVDHHARSGCGTSMRGE